MSTKIPLGGAVDRRLQPVLDGMRTATAQRGDASDGLYRWFAFHLGWADAEGRPVEARTAKGIRPLACLIASEAVGGSPALAVPAAIAIELTHEFSLIHDDIQDGDRLRRGRPALWTVIGTAQAINAGDALFAIARRQLLRSNVPPHVLLDALGRFDEACIRLAEGQFLDVAFESGGRVTAADYIGMVARKTGALLSASVALGAAIGGAEQAEVDGMARFGEAVGVAFQMRDDVLGLWGDPARTGKPAGSDLVHRKRSLPVLLALEDPELGPELAALYASSTAGDGAEAALAARIEASGYRERAAAVAREHAEEALSALDGLDLQPGPRDELLALARLAVDRDR